MKVNTLSENLSPEYTFVNAGAGAGKTTNLVWHIVSTYVNYKQKLGREPRIIGTTFTRKAANEIKERVAGFYKKFRPGNEHLLNELDKNHPHREYVESHLQELFDFAYSDSLNITTIHGICVQIIMKKAHLLGYSPTLKIVSSGHIGFFQKKLLFNILEQDEYSCLYEYFSFSKILELMNELERSSQEAKTPASLEDLQGLYLRLIDEIRTESKFILSFDEENLGALGNQTQKVKDYIKSIRVKLNQALEAKDLNVFKDFLDNEIISMPAPRGKACDPDALTEFNFYKESYKNIRDTYFSKDKFSKYFDKSFYKLVADVNATLFAVFQKFSEDLRRYKKEKSFILMEEVELLALEILQNYPQECEDFIEMWDYWYIDEYQDTSPIQAEIFSLLLKNKSYYKVGDPQQSIYLFRGAESSLFTTEWEGAQKNPNIKDMVLDTNYRSRPHLMAGMNEFFEHLENTSDEFKESFKPMKPSPSMEDDQPLRFHLRIFSQNEDEQKFVIAEIQKLLAEDVQPEKICILARSKDILKDYESALTLSKIPSLAQFSGGFVDRPEIQGALNFLKVMRNPHDDLELIKLLRTQNFKISDAELRDWCAEYKENRYWSLWDGVVKNKAHSSVHKVLEFYFSFKEKDYIEGFKKFLQEASVLDAAYDSTDWARRNSNLLKLYTYICKRSESSSYTLDQIIDDLSFVQEEDLQSEAIFSESQNGIKLFTIHGSKGLEFEYVFFIGAGKQVPLSHSRMIEIDSDSGVFVIPVSHPEDKETKATVLRYFSHKDRILSEKKEARRVIYVAATRAKEKLYITGTAKQKKNSSSSGAEQDGAGETDEALNSETRQQSLFHIIDIDQFIKMNWNHIAVHNDTQAEEPLAKAPDFEHLQFSLSLEPELLNKDKLVFAKRRVDKAPIRDTVLRAYSVSSVVEKMAEEGFQGFDYQVLKESEISKINLKDLLVKQNTAPSEVLLEKLLKPYMGDVFHKAIELFTHEVPEAEVRSYLQGFFADRYEPIFKLIQEIASVTEPNMKSILKTARPEWGFNSLIEEQILLSGQIDLWGFDESGAIHILDYKTGSKRHIKKAAFQLSLYKKVLKKLYPETSMFTHIIYPVEGSIVSVDVNQPVLNL